MKTFTKYFAVIMLSLFVLTACEDDSYVAPAQDDLQNTADVLETYDQEVEFDEATTDENGRRWGRKRRKERVTFFTLTSALIRTGLIKTVATEELTVFAPTDAAFAKLGINPWNVWKVPNLKEILLYHVVGGKVFSTDLSNGFVPTVNGAAVEINLDGGVFVNDAQVIKADIRTKNGVIHAINNVLLPPTENIVEIAAGNENFSILVEAVSRVNLVGALSGDDQLTVFAPTNDAFVALLGELGATSLDDIDDETLTAVLLYHVVPGRVYSSDLAQDLEVGTLNGGTFTVDLGNLALIDANERSAGLVADLLNLQATNGVIHVIDRVILP